MLARHSCSTKPRSDIWVGRSAAPAPERDALGKAFYWPDLKRQGYIVGVVKDFHIGTLRDPTEPAFLAIQRAREFSLLVKIRPERMRETIDFPRGDMAVVFTRQAVPVSVSGTMPLSISTERRSV